LTPVPQNTEQLWGEESFGRKAIISLASSYGMQFFATALNFLSKIILARLILPEHWGLFAEAFLILSIFETVRDFGVSQHLIRHTDPPYGNALIMEVSLSVFLILIMQIIAPYFSFLGAGLPTVLRILLLTSIIQAVGSVPEIYIHKELLLQEKIIPSILNNLVFLAVSVLLGLKGMGVWSLIIGQRCGAAIYTLALWRRVAGRIDLKFTLVHTAELIKGGSGLLFLALLGVVGSQIDYGIIGALLSQKKIGYYFMALSLVLYPTRFVENAFHNVVYPAFARYQQAKEKLGEVYLLTTSVAMALEIPIYAWVFFNAPVMVRLLLGPRWIAVVPLVRLLSLLPIIDPFSIFGQALLKATRRDKLLSVALVIGTGVFVVSSIVLTKRFAIYGAAVARYIIPGNLIIIVAVRSSVREHFAKLAGKLAVIYAASFSVLGVISVLTGALPAIVGLMGSLAGVALCWFLFYVIFFHNASGLTGVKQVLFSRA